MNCNYSICCLQYLSFSPTEKVNGKNQGQNWPSSSLWAQGLTSHCKLLIWFPINQERISKNQTHSTVLLTTADPSPQLRWLHTNQIKVPSLRNANYSLGAHGCLNIFPFTFSCLTSTLLLQFSFFLSSNHCSPCTGPHFAHTSRRHDVWFKSPIIKGMLTVNEYPQFSISILHP